MKNVIARELNYHQLQKLVDSLLTEVG